jgi:penicillin-binding protein 2
MKSTLQMDQKTDGKAINNIVKYGEMYGLGKSTGIDIPEGFSGYISSPSLKKELYNQEWVTGDLLNAAIGQGNTLVSPLQILNMTATIAANGNIIQPKVVAATSDSSNNKMTTSSVSRGKVDVSQNTFNTIKDGMMCGVHDPGGIITLLNSPYTSVAAKSGTAEFGPSNPATGGYLYNHGWVTGYFPSDNPQFAFTILLEKSPNSGSTVAIARKFIDWLYKDYGIDKIK